MKKIFTLLIVTLLLFNTVGCSQEGEESEIKEAQQTEAPDDVASETVSTEPVELRLVINSETLDSAMEKAVTEFELSHENVTVKVETVPWSQFLDKAAVMFAAGESPDVIHMPVLVTKAYASSGYLMDLSDFLSQEDKDDFVKSGLETVTYNEGIYGMPHFLDSVSVFYNKNMFKNADIDAPTTYEEAWSWEEFVTNVTKLKEVNDTDYGIILGSDISRSMPFLYQNNATILNEDQTQSGINTEAGIESLAYLKSWFDSGLTPVEAFLGAEEPAAMFIQQKAPIIVDAAGFMNRFTAEISDFEYGIMPMPVKKGIGNKIGGWNLSVSENSENKQLAAELCYFITNTENGAAAASASGAVPARYSSQSIADYGVNQERANLVMLEVNSMPTFAINDVATVKYLGYKAILTENIQSMVIGEMSPAETAEKIEKEINENLFN